MPKRAIDGIRDLAAATAGPDITATVTVDQVYAQVQHEALEFAHPRGGMAKYVTTPLLSDHPKWIQRFADRLLETNDAEIWWGHTAGTGLVDAIATHAPLLFNDLRRSAGLEVHAGAGMVMSIPPEVPRMNEDEIAFKSALIAAGNIYGRDYE